jgi:hypothetical protein
VYAFLVQYGRFVWASLYLGGFYPLFSRWQGYLVAYLRQFPPVDGVPLDRYHGGLGGNHSSPFAQASVMLPTNFGHARTLKKQEAIRRQLRISPLRQRCART